MKNTINTITISSYNSASIKAIASKLGVAHMELIAQGRADGDSNNPNSLIRFFKIGETRVADTNGDPIWEDEDMQAFAELAAECGVEI